MQKLVTAYAELREWVRGFAKGALDVLIVEGSPGVGKSTIVKQVMVGKARIIEGRTSASRLYVELHRNADKPFVIDDVDDLYTDRAAVNLLKCLCRTDELKWAMWNTNAPWLEELAIPREFDTKTKVAILTNRWETLNNHSGAVEDRGVLIRFRPSAEELHRYVATAAFDPNVFDQEVYEYIGDHLAVIAEPSIRHHRHAIKLKQGGLDWQGTLLESFGLAKKRALIWGRAARPPMAEGLCIDLIPLLTTVALWSRR
jgi:hypothetical protein